MKRYWVYRGLKALIVVALAATLFGYLVMSLWNWVLPPITGWHAIGFAQAVALLVLCRVLFGGFRRYGHGWRWRQQMRERWEQMTPQERVQLQVRFGHRCGASRAQTGPSQA
jgi:hypothetical protein